MDNLTHTLAGWALAETGLKRTTAWGTVTLIVAANLPDVDGFSYLVGGRTIGLSFRRGWTHGALAMVVLPPLLLLLLLGWQRLLARQTERMRPGWLLLLAALGIWSHPLLDLLNTYGVRLLMPFASRWFYGDALFIVDPWLWLLLGAGILWSRRRARHSGSDPWRAGRPAQLAVGFAAGYALLMGLGSRYAVAAVARQTGSLPGEPILAAPVFGASLQRSIIRDLGTSYELGRLQLGLRPQYQPREVVAKGTELAGAAAAARTAAGASFLKWARLPAYEMVREGDSIRVTISDMRYRGAGNRTWASVTVRVSDEPPSPPRALDRTGKP